MTAHTQMIDAAHYPSTRYMGAKEKILPQIRNVAMKFKFETAVDLFSGTGVVGYLFKTMGKQVLSTDYMAMNATIAAALIANNDVVLSASDVDGLFRQSTVVDPFVTVNFTDIYYSQEDCLVIDIVRSNIEAFDDPIKKSIAMSALIRACLKKRPRGIYTYTGIRYDDGRKDLRMSMEEHIRQAVDALQGAIFDNGLTCSAIQMDAMDVGAGHDLVYMDPPYYSKLSDNEYVRRYHFVEGLARKWHGVSMQWNTKTKKFKSYPTPFSTLKGTVEAFETLFEKHRKSIIILSYSSNSLPTCDELVTMLSKHKKYVEVTEVEHTYSIGNRKKAADSKSAVTEYIIAGYGDGDLLPA